MPAFLRVLILEDQPADAELIVHELRQAGFEPTWQRVETEADYLAHLSPTIDIILADDHLPEFDALRALQVLQERGLDIPLILVSRVLDEAAIVAALQHGAADYVTKGRLARLGLAVRQALDQKHLRDEKRQADATLRESEARYRTASALTSDYADVVRVEPGGGYVREWVAGAFTHITGYTPEEVDARGGFLSLVYPDDLPIALRHRERLLSGQEDVSEFRIITKSGEVRWRRIYDRPIWDAAQGRVTYIYGVAQDITERKETQERMASFLRFQNEMLDTAAIWIDTLDSEGNVTFWNRAAERISGYSKEEVLGHGKIWEWLYPDPNYRAQIFAKAMEIIQKGERVENFETAILCKSGEERIISWHSNNLADQEEKIVGSIALGADITERKRAEEYAQQQLARISLLNQITRAIADRRDTDSIFRVVLKHMEDHLPIDIGSVLLFNSQTDTFTVAARGPKSQPLAAGLGTPEGMVISVDQFDQAGLRAWMQGKVGYVPDTVQNNSPLLQQYAQAGIHSVVTTPLIIENNLFGILGAARREVNSFSSAEVEFLRILSEHVSLAVHQARLHHDLQKAYNDLRQTQQAVMQQERLRALGQMASGIAHDVNNTLSPILGYTDLLLSSEPDLSNRARRFLETIKTASIDITNIVARMREFYRKREEREPLFSTNLNRLVQQVIALTRPRWRDIPQERSIVIAMQTDLQDDLPTVLGIESELREALTNLIFNAVDAMPSGGVIRLQTRVERGRKSPILPFVILTVTDTGIGMTEEVRQRCLEPFFSTKGERGTGLGLALVYGVMQRHEGDIEIESDLGQGTTVRLIFPIREPAKVEVATPQAFVLPSPLRVLCIDDEPLLRELLKEMLQSDGHRVEVADGGQAGLAVFRDARERGESFNLVITDLGMPYMDGREVARTIKRESPQTPVILLTGWGSRMKAESDIPAQIDHVLSKPPKMNELREALSRVTRPSHHKE
ncbi:MAG: PAS domain S-box protein [Candidatus Tectomicrobia bacterium]|nr:PAS domain S-box protein [Candidatus Tectomicrobia bacterium]